VKSVDSISYIARTARLGSPDFRLPTPVSLRGYTVHMAADIETSLQEQRVFNCSEDFRAHAHRPDDIRFTDSLPKTRSGKIMRRLLRELAGSGEVKGDTTTLEDFGA
jgi:acetyl-CoA synthetase